MSIILSITPYQFLPVTNGGQLGIHIVDSTLSIYNKVHTLTVSSSLLKENYPYQLHPLLTSKQRRYIPYACSNAIWRLAKKIKPNYIFCHHHYLFPSSYRIAKKLKVPCYIRSHNIEAERFKSAGKFWWPLMKQFEKWAYRKADRVFFVTQEDRHWAIDHYALNEEKASVMPFGIPFSSTPDLPKSSAKDQAAHEYNLKNNVPWMFFMGKLDYEPNHEALRVMIEKIVPELKKTMLEYEILICGTGLSEDLIQKIQLDPSIHYLGFVPEIGNIISACEIMINPILSGGGVKTKVIESLSWNKTVVSTESGAKGIEKEVCGNKLLIAKDNDWGKFVQLVIIGINNQTDIPKSFYDTYNINAIAQRMQPYFQ